MKRICATVYTNLTRLW